MDESRVTYFLHCSRPELEEAELAALNRAANHRKRLAEIFAEAVDATAEAMLVRGILEQRTARALGRPPSSALELIAELLPEINQPPEPSGSLVPEPNHPGARRAAS